MDVTCFDAAEQVTKLVRLLWKNTPMHLEKYNLSNAINTLSQKSSVWAGGVSKQGENLLRPIRSYMDRFCFDRFAAHRTQVRIAELGNDAGITSAQLDRRSAG